ncbi:MAG: hypothetical protein AAF289_08875 [Cyanobacteria bacterium P01_A01_bin.135]
MSLEPTLYEALELLPAGSVYQTALEGQQTKSHPVARALRAAGAYLLAFLAPSDEPQVEVRLKEGGALQFAAYDPVTHQCCVCAGEEGLRAWLELRYYVAPVR